MSELGEFRKDYLLDRWVLINKGRGKRPRQFQQVGKTLEAKKCFFCPGNENLTPPEIGRHPKRGPWEIRWFENKFPALKPIGKPDLHSEQFFTYRDAYGHHWIMVESAKHDKQLADLDEKQVEQILRAYVEIINDLESKPNVQYVSVIKNHGLKAGTSILHTHSQIFGMCQTPPRIKEKLSAIRKFIECPHCKIIRQESQSVRKCFENEEWVAFCPYASRFNYEIWVYPKQHVTRMEHASIPLLAEIMKKVLVKVSALGSYNFYLQYSPKGEDLHFHIEVTPRIATWAGFEFCSGVIINSVAPEDAAKYYRE